MDLNILNSYLKLHYLGNKFFVLDEEDDEIKEYYLISIAFDFDGMHYLCGSNKFSLHTVKTNKLFGTKEEAEKYRKEKKQKGIGSSYS